MRTGQLRAKLVLCSLSALVGAPVHILLCAAPARASLSIEILGESYSASTDAMDNEYGTRLSDGTTRTTPPAHAEITHKWRMDDILVKPVWDDAGDRVFHIESGATRYEEGGGIAFHAYQTTDYWWDWQTGRQISPFDGASASLTVDFRVRGPDGRLNIDASRDVLYLGFKCSWAETTLTDVTTGQSWDILGETWDCQPDDWICWPPMEATVSIPIDTAHVYRLAARAYPTGEDDGPSSVTVTFRGVTIVPASSSHELTISGGAGGRVISPGSGTFTYEEGTSVLIVAAADAGYRFTGWTGTAVDAGKVNNPAAVSTSLIVTGDYTVRANFEVVAPPPPQATLNGIVIRLDTQGQAKGALAGATVSLSGATTKTTTTNSQGEFSFTRLNAGTFTVTVSKAGYYSVTRTVQLSQGQTRSETFNLTAQSSNPSAFDFSSPNGRHFIEGMPGDLRFEITVAWNGSPGSVRFKVAGVWRNATISDLGGGKARAVLAAAAPSTILSCSELSVEVTNDEGKKTSLTPGVYFYPLPDIVEYWVWNGIGWRREGYRLVCSDGDSWVLWDIEDRISTLSTKGVLSYDQTLSFDPMGGVFGGSLRGGGQFWLDMDTSNVAVMTDSSLSLTGGLDVALAGCGVPSVRPFWNLSLSGEAGVTAPAVVVVGLVFPPAKPSIDAALNVPGLSSVLKALKLSLFLSSDVRVNGRYGAGQIGDCFLGAKSIDLSGTFGIEGRAEINTRLGGVSINAGGSGAPRFNVCPEFQFCDVTLNAYAGIHAYIMLLSWQKDIIDKKFGTEITLGHGCAGTYSTLHTNGVLAVPELEIRGRWVPIGDGYLKWGQANRVLGGSTPTNGLGRISIAAEDGTSRGQQGESVVVENVYPLAAPSIASSSPVDTVLFSLHDPDKPWYGATDIAFVIRGIDGSWTLDRIRDDDLAEFGPAIVNFAPETGLALATWMVVSGDVSDANDPSQIAPHLEIAAALFDRLTGRWTAPVQLTSNDAVDRDPLPVVFGGRQGVLWVENQGGELVGTSQHHDSLLFAEMADTGWQQAQVLYADVNGISSFRVCVDRNEECHVILDVDEDGDNETTSDRELYWLATSSGVWQPPVRLTDDQCTDAAPVLVASEGRALCVWNADGTLLYSFLDAWSPRPIYTETTLANEVSSLSGAALANGATIAYTVQGPSGIDIFASFYDAALDAWSLPRQLTDDDGSESSLSLGCDGNDLVITYLKTQTIRQGMDVEVNGEMQHLQNVPQAGRTDVCMLRHALGRDPAVVVQSLALDPPNAPPGETAMISATIQNRGDLPLQNLRVAFYDGDPCDGGVMIGNVHTIAGILIAGGEQDMSVSWNVPSAEQPHRVFVVVDPDGSVNDRNPENNRASTLTVLPDLGIETCWSGDFSPTQVLLTARLTNAGAIMSAPFTVSWRLGAADGKEIGTSDVATLVSGGVCEISHVWDASGDLEPNQPAQVFVVVDSGGAVQEFDESNNSASCVVIAGSMEEEATLPDPVAHWPLDEGEQSTPNSAGGGSARVYGATVVPGVIGNALSFDGDDDYVDCGEAEHYAPERLTVSFWVQREKSYLDNRYMVARCVDSGFARDYTLAMQSDSKVEFSFGENADNSVRLRSKGVVAVAEWTFVAATRDGVQASIYLNGELDSSAAYSFVPNNKGQGLKIGAGARAPWGFFKGKIDDVRIYDRALSAKEVLTLYQKESP